MKQTPRILTELSLLVKGKLHHDSPFAAAGYVIMAGVTVFLFYLYLTTDMPFRTFLIGPVVMAVYWLATSFAHTPAVYKIVDRVLGVDKQD